MRTSEVFWLGLILTIVANTCGFIETVYFGFELFNKTSYQLIAEAACGICSIIGVLMVVGALIARFLFNR